MKLYTMQAKPESFEQRLDLAVEEVFGAMLGVSCVPVKAVGWTTRQEMIGAIVGLAGSMRGSCVVHVNRASGMRIAELLTGSADNDHGMVQDALGELCNMIAGTWKGGIPELAAGCMLSPPVVIEGYDFRLHSQPSPFHIQSRYQFGPDEMEVTLHGEMGK
ncbi:MAG: chemotaxis protein CheX [Acidobacteriaceae bacterium]